MITKLTIDKVASFKTSRILETNKKVNLIYGLNGTGKSTLSNFLHRPKDIKFKDCSIEGLDENHEIIVYNQTFIQENFFESESLKGIFTLSKTNKEAESKIASAEKEIIIIDNAKAVKEKELQKIKDDFESKRTAAKNKIWEIKTSYTGGDRVLEFCLENLKSDKEKLLTYIESIKKTESKPLKSIDKIKSEVQALSGENVQTYSLLPQITFSAQHIENELLFKKQIVGNENSTVSGLINKIGSSDWVRDGLKYVKTEIENENEICPFCQEKTISKDLINSIKDYFDESYEEDLKTLKEYYNNYLESFQSLPDKSTFESNPKYETYKKVF